MAGDLVHDRGRATRALCWFTAITVVLEPWADVRPGWAHCRPRIGLSATATDIGW